MEWQFDVTFMPSINVIVNIIEQGIPF